MKKKILYILLVVVAVCLGAVGLIGCKKVAEIVLPAPENVAYDGQYVTWDKVDLAKHYTVSIDGSEAERANSTTYAYATTETFTVTVTAVFEGAEKATTVTFKPLGKIAALTVAENGTVGWDAVAGATAYAVSIDGKISTVTDTVVTVPAGTHRVKARPIVAGDSTYWSMFSDEVQLTVFEAPSTVKYDGEAITWIGNASAYEVTVNGIAHTAVGNRYVFDSQNKDFTVSIKAVGDHASTFDSAVTTEEFHYLSPVGALNVEDGLMKWNAVDGAEGYLVQVDGVTRPKTVETSVIDDLPSGRSIDVAVMPFNNSGNYFSSWSAVKTVYILDTPQTSWNSNLELDGEANNNFTWDAVNAANGYTVRLCKDGGVPEIKTYSEAQRAFAHAYADVGTYTVEVKANATVGGDHYDSKFSAPTTVKRLAAPKAATGDYIVSNRDSLSDGFTVNFQQVSGASGYQLYKNGVLMNGKYTTTTFALTDTAVSEGSTIESQHHTYAVRSMGGVKTENNATVATLPCLTSAALSFDITVQATPQNATMSGFNLRWDNVTGNNGYAVAYAGSTLTAAGTTYDLSVLAAGDYQVTVAARGNGGATLASNPSAPVAIKRLVAPTEIKISSIGNGTLQWKEVANATSYEAFLDLSTSPLNTNAFGNMYQFITTQGSVLSMRAVANRYNAENTLYYMTSPLSPTQQFIRLAAPTFPEGALENSAELVWNVPSNINTADYTPTYKAFSAIGEQIGGGSLNDTKLNIANYEGGKSYTFYIKAIGDDNKYLDSDYSESIRAYKIATPVLRIENNNYVWDAVQNASSYYIEIDGVKASDAYHASGNTYTFTPRYTTEGDHIVKLKAVGDGRGNLDSAFYTYTQKTKILPTPQITYGYSAGKITVQVTAVSNCTKYAYEVAGQSVDSSSTTFTKDVTAAGKYGVRVKALGGTIDASGIYYVDSLYAGGSASDYITLLSAPAESSFVITSDGAVTFDDTNPSLGYTYQLAFDDGTFGEEKTTSSSAFTIANHRQYRSITVKLRARGDGNKIIASDWVTWTWTNRT